MAHIDLEANNHGQTSTILSDDDANLRDYNAVSNHILKKSVRNLKMEDDPSKYLSSSEIIIENAPVVVSFKDLIVKHVKTGNILLNNCSGSINGGYWAIMGPSGGGKTTLLLALARRLDPNKMQTLGEVRINGKKFDNGVLKAMSAFVLQDDLLYAELTVKETIEYAAGLRLADFSSKFQAERIDAVVGLMQVDKIKDVIIGDSRNKGISGGERKRVCVAVELLTNPKLLFLDEPTSGLDSTTALQVCTTLRSLADKGYCTVVCTIHQPQKSIYEFSDNLILMRRGSIVYMGKTKNAVPYIEAQTNTSCGKNENPADYIIDAISSNDTKANEVAVPDINREYKNKASFQRQPFTVKNWVRQFIILFQRAMQQYLRRRLVIVMNLLSTIILAIFISTGVWYQIGTTQSSLATRLPSLFFGCVTQGVVAALQSIAGFPVERAIILRERASGAYFVSSYFWAKSVVDILSNSWPVIIFCVFVYPATGYQNNASKFFTYLIMLLLETWAALSLATMVSCFMVTLEASTVVLSLLLEISRLYGGFFTSPAQLIEFAPNWAFADAMSYLKYTYVALALNELHGLELQCVTNTGVAVPMSRCIRYGGQLIESFGYDRYTIPICAGCLVAYIFICRFLGYFALRVFKA